MVTVCGGGMFQYNKPSSIHRNAPRKQSSLGHGLLCCCGIMQLRSIALHSSG